MQEASFIGGSRIGRFNASIPFVRLVCRRDRLRLTGFPSCEFSPEQVVSFDTYGSVPLLGNGLRIHHNRPDLPDKIVFWCLGSRSRVLAAIARIGFVPTGRPADSNAP